MKIPLFLSKTFILHIIYTQYNIVIYKTLHRSSSYVALTKINYAKNILKTTENSITEIADLLGYSSDASFINAFKK